MKKALYLAAILAAITCVPPAHAENDLLKQSTQACIFGAAVLGVTSVIVLYPAMVVGTSGIPTTSLVIGNTLFGCGISALGAAAAGIYGQMYDKMFPDQVGTDSEVTTDSKSATPAAAPQVRSETIPQTSPTPPVEAPKLEAPVKPTASNQGSL